MNKQLATLIIIVVVATVLYLITGRFQTQNISIPCTQEGKICPDGTVIRRSGPNCQFAACPIKVLVTSPSASATPNITYKCPSGAYVDCMPGPGTKKPECSSQYLQWAKLNCPNFKGAAY